MNQDVYEVPFTRTSSVSVVVAASIAIMAGAAVEMSRCPQLGVPVYVQEKQFIEQQCYAQVSWDLSEGAQVGALRRFAERLLAETKEAPAEVSSLVTDNFWQLV